MMKRIILFVATNILVMLTISIVLRVLGIGNYVTPYGLNYTSLAVFCLIWGMAGSFISLAISRIMAKWAMGVQVIDPARPGEFRDLVERVHRLAREAKLPAMPQVGIYQSPELNAFATGPSKSRSLVAVSTGLLQRMDDREVDGVLGHEIAHIANGDMVTMTLIQGVVNAFVMFFARVIAYALSMAFASRSESEEGSAGPNPMIMWVTTFVLEIVFGMLGMLVVCWFSRQREYRADRGGAAYAGRSKMIDALRALQRNYDRDHGAGHAEDKPAIATLKISGKKSGMMSFFSTHPDLDDRIARLQAQAA